MNDDAVLLRRYAEEGSESAFAELVRCHVDLVYGAALRRTNGDAHRAADVAQQVFTALARKARKLSRHTVLVGWLHTATRNAALNLMISEQRRKEREHAVLTDPALSTRGENSDWEQLRPVLDAAIDELPETDRAAVVLRFLERRAFAEIGAVLRVSEDAARMRTDRALEKLRALLASRGITSTAAALGAIVSSQPLLSAPAGLAAKLAAASLASVGASAGFLTATFVSFMSAKTIITATTCALFAFGIGTYVGRTRTVDVALPSAPREVQRESPVSAALRQDNAALKAEVDRLKSDIEKLDAVNAHLAAQPAAPPAPRAKNPTLGMSRGQQQRAILNNLRQISAALDQYFLENGHAPASVQELVGATAYIKAVRTVSGEDYSGLSMAEGQPMTVTSPDGTTVTYDPIGGNSTRPELSPQEQRAEEASRRMEAEEEQRAKGLEERIGPAFKKAVEAFRAANNGNDPPDEQAVVRYFATPQEAADFLEAVKAAKAAGR